MQKIIVDENSVGSRLDLFLVEGIFFNTEKTRGDILRLIKNEKVLVNNKIIKPSYKLKEGDEIIIFEEEVSRGLKPNHGANLEIIFQDSDIIVVNKPYGMVVHPSDYREDNTLVNFLLGQFPEIDGIGDGSRGAEFRPGIVHRLDKDTSGVMVIARNQKSFLELKNIFQSRKITKKYLAVVYGNVIPSNGVIKKDMARAKGYKKQIIAHKKTKTVVREAVTEYSVIKTIGKYSLVEARPKTGRTHQLRVHFFSIGNPIVGDKLYRNKQIKNIEHVKRQLLHSNKLEFELFGKHYNFKVNMPQDMLDFIYKTGGVD